MKATSQEKLGFYLGEDVMKYTRSMRLKQQD
jgi:hypothetical protein